MTVQPDIYTRVTDQIIAVLEKGTPSNRSRAHCARMGCSIMVRLHDCAILKLLTHV